MPPPNRLSKIKAILFDVDGVLTDGLINVDSLGNQTLNFNVKDGQLISFMQKTVIYLGRYQGANPSQWFIG
jgi:3-deoxy-D-manno-octulosonate 8-phosphate phosphatase (KDO 8-P phosphatase)